jgi:hypothetical protein
VGHGRGDRSEADPQRHVQLPDEVDDRGREGLPPKVGLGATHDEEVTAREAAVPDDESGPRQIGHPAVDDLERGPPRPVVEQLVAVELGDDRRLAGELLERGGGGVAGVDPAVERGDERRRDDVVGRFEAVEGHRRSIGGRAGKRRHRPGHTRSATRRDGAGA